jgi:hypothetical protein
MQAGDRRKDLAGKVICASFQYICLQNPAVSRRFWRQAVQMAIIGDERSVYLMELTISAGNEAG